jgi:hypothetical protein
MAFYVGCYVILADSLEPKTDHGPWALPDGFNDQHMADTNNVEELFINVDEMDVLPTQIQFGSGEWADDAGFDSSNTFAEFYVRDEAFYLRGFTASDGYLQAFYPASGFFYTRAFTGVDFFTPMFYGSGGFYVRGWTSGTELYSQFYVKTQESFYVRSWTPVDFFYPFAEPTC